MKRWILYAAVIIQLALVFGHYTYYRASLGNQTYLLETVPVDPRDLLRGDYIILNYDINTIPETFDLPDLEHGTLVYALLKPDGDFWKLQDVRLNQPDDTEHYLRGVYQGYRRIVYDIERYYVPEGKGNPPHPITVEISITHTHRPLIRQLYADGLVWP